MDFTPDNELERAMLRAVADEAARPAFYQLLLDSELLLLGVLDDNMRLDTVESQGQKFHPAFTSAARKDAFVPPSVPSFRLQGRQLFEITRGAQFVLNPGSEIGKTLTAEEIAWCLETFGPQRGGLYLAQPKEFPTKLVKALCILFTSRSLIRAAHLVYVARHGIDTEGHPMIGLEADGDVPRLAQEIFETYEAVFPGKPIEVVYVDPKGPLDPLQQHLLSVPPFYRRMLSMN